MEFTSFDERYVAGAQGLLERRTKELSLPSRAFESGAGVAAIDEGRVVGFLLGNGGRTRLSQHAAVTRDVYREMYAVYARDIVEREVLVHTVAVAAADDLSTWFELGFGIDQVKGVRSLDPMEAPSLDVRRASAEDLGALGSLAAELTHFHAGAPIFKYADGPWALPESAASELERDLPYLWLAVQEGEPVGFMNCAPDETTPGGVHIGIAATTADVRAGGVGTAILARVLAWARDEGFEAARVGWTSANLVSDRFWRRRGFRPLYYTLSRRIDERFSTSRSRSS